MFIFLVSFAFRSNLHFRIGHSFIHSGIQYMSDLKKNSDIIWIFLSIRAWLHVVDYTEIVAPIVVLCCIYIAGGMSPKLELCPQYRHVCCCAGTANFIKVIFWIFSSLWHVVCVLYSTLPNNYKTSNVRYVLNVVCFLLGDFSASEFYMPTFRNTLFHLQREVGMKYEIYFVPTYLWRWNRVFRNVGI